MVYNSYLHITTGVSILFEPKKGPLWAKKGIFKPPKRPKNRHFGPKHLQKSSYGFKMINYGPQ